ncbi:GNAT family N-acetyltransferase [Brachybacterium sp. AOP43-C2-M15]|uniref:GNAT family N-acetyltransferase n=1 Tax=Brachybacterium sp. AOP43-C2-M15 TaxID=3457661 RepID=UPI0040340E7D
MTTTAEHASPLRDGRTLVWERTTWEDPRGAALRAAMDAEIGPRYEALRRRRPAPPSSEDVDHVLLALVDGETAATGTLRRLPDRWEVKRLFIDADHRRLGLASAVLARLEEGARERGATELFLQTGDRQPEAIALYEREGWERIAVFAPYDPADSVNVCFRKEL